MEGAAERSAHDGMHWLVTGRRRDKDHFAMSGHRWTLLLSVVLLSTSATLDARRTTACDDHDDLVEFNDVASLTVLSSAVFDGRPVQGDGDEDVVEFRVGQFYKGGEMFPEGLQQSTSSAAVRVAVRLSSTQCARFIRPRRRRFLVFLNESQEGSAVFWSTAPPVRFSRRSVRIIKKHSCPNCGRSFMITAPMYYTYVYSSQGQTI